MNLKYIFPIPIIGSNTFYIITASCDDNSILYSGEMDFLEIKNLLALNNFINLNFSNSVHHNQLFNMLPTLKLPIILSYDNSNLYNYIINNIKRISSTSQLKLSANIVPVENLLQKTVLLVSKSKVGYIATDINLQTCKLTEDNILKIRSTRSIFILKSFHKDIPLSIKDSTYLLNNDILKWFSHFLLPSEFIKIDSIDKKKDSRYFPNLKEVKSIKIPFWVIKQITIRTNNCLNNYVDMELLKVVFDCNKDDDIVEIDNTATLIQQSNKEQSSNSRIDLNDEFNSDEEIQSDEESIKDKSDQDLSNLDNTQNDVQLDDRFNLSKLNINKDKNQQYNLTELMSMLDKERNRELLRNAEIIKIPHNLKSANLYNKNNNNTNDENKYSNLIKQNNDSDDDEVEEEIPKNDSIKNKTRSKILGLF